jgi:hypothetical protein
MNPSINWWYGATGGSNSKTHSLTFYRKNIDTKLNRIAAHDAGLLVKDRLVQENPSIPVTNILTGLKVKLIDFAMDGEMSNLLESVGIRAEIIKSYEVPTFLLQTKPDPNQIIILSGLYPPQPREILQALTTFIQEGGRLFLINCASPNAAAITLGKVIPGPPSTTVKAPVHITAERDVFTGFQNLMDIDLEACRLPIDVQDKKDTKILVKVLTSKEEPLFVKATLGLGTAYILTSKLWTSPQVSWILIYFIIDNDSSTIRKSTT